MNSVALYSKIVILLLLLLTKIYLIYKLSILVLGSILMFNNMVFVLLSQDVFNLY